MQSKVYEFGYQGRTIKSIEEKLKELDAVLFDVRYQPFSRNPIWSKTNLERVLGCSYKHVRDLGNVNYKGVGALLSDEEGGIQAILDAIKSRPVIIMCVCSNFLTCHRALIAELLDEHGIEVEELFPEPQRSLNLW